MSYLTKIKNLLTLFAFLLLLTFNSCKGTPEQKERDDNGNNNTIQQTDDIHDQAVPEKEVSDGESDPAKEQSLRYAALEGNHNMVERLISSNTDINSSESDGRTALMLASFNGHSRIMLNLIEAGAGIELKDEFGRTALMYASTGSFPDAVKLLLEHGADPNLVDDVEQFTPLMFAAAEGHMEVVNILLSNGADPSLKDKDGDTAESFARQNGHSEIVDLLSRVCQ